MPEIAVVDFEGIDIKTACHLVPGVVLEIPFQGVNARACLNLGAIGLFPGNVIEAQADMGASAKA